VPLVRIDPHAHLYDCYPVRDWVAAAIRNLCPEAGVCAGVIVVDRAGQDSFARLRSEVPKCGEWSDVGGSGPTSFSQALGQVVYEGNVLFVIPGVQYVTKERLEILGLGVRRSIDDGGTCEQTVEQIRSSGGIACLSWSPGKWLGERGKVVDALRARYRPGEIVFGDIAMRSVVGPPSLILRAARRDGYPVLRGTDPLPRVSDVALVGSYGVEFSSALTPDQPGWLAESLGSLLSPAPRSRVWGRPCGPLTALKRFCNCSAKIRNPRSGEDKKE